METCLSYEKEATTDYPIVDEIRNRWSPRAFADKAVEPEKLLSLLEAARWAPSSFNEQPWHFIVTTKDDGYDYDRLLQSLSPFNRKWASTAPVLLMSVAGTRFSKNDKPNRHALHDVGLASGNLLAQATAMGLHVHMMGGYDAEKVRESFSIPEGYEPVAAIALGYLGDPEILPEEMQSGETALRKRKKLGDFLHGSNWGDKPGLLN